MKQKLHLSLKKDLIDYIKKENLKSHDNFLSENEVINRYQVSNTTAQKALLALQREGIVYRIPYKGTYVSPPCRTGSILVVALDHKNSYDFDQLEFMAKLTVAYRERGVTCACLSISQSDLVSQLTDLIYIYRDLMAIIFYRRVGPLLDIWSDLSGLRVPVFFYGSDVHLTVLSSLKGLNTCLYNERTITTLSLDHLFEKGYKEIACVYYDMPGYDVSRQRYAEYINWMIQHNLSILKERIFPVFTYGDFEVFRKEMSRCKYNAVFCCSGGSLNRTIQALRINGLSIPSEVAVIGQANNMAAHQVFPILTRVEIQVENDTRSIAETIDRINEMGGENKTPFKIESIPKLVLGEST